MLPLLSSLLLCNRASVFIVSCIQERLQRSHIPPAVYPPGFQHIAVSYMVGNIEFAALVQHITALSTESE